VKLSMMLVLTWLGTAPGRAADGPAPTVSLVNPTNYVCHGSNVEAQATGTLYHTPATLVWTTYPSCGSRTNTITNTPYTNKFTFGTTNFPCAQTAVTIKAELSNGPSGEINIPVLSVLDVFCFIGTNTKTLFPTNTPARFHAGLNSYAGNDTNWGPGELSWSVAFSGASLIKEGTNSSWATNTWTAPNFYDAYAALGDTWSNVVATVWAPDIVRAFWSNSGWGLYIGGQQSVGGATNTVTVGEHISLLAVLQPFALPLDAAFNNYPSNVAWGVSGQIVKDYEMTAETNSAGEIINTTATTALLADSDLHGTNLSFYWIDGAWAAPVQYTGSCDGVTFSSTAYLDVARPTWSQSNRTCQTAPGIFFNGATNSLGQVGAVLGFGAAVAPNTVGILWNADVCMSNLPSAAGEVALLQLMKLDHHRSGFGSNEVRTTGTSFFLDGQTNCVFAETNFLFSESSNTFAILGNDSPFQNGYCTNFVANWDAQTFLMYRPPSLKAIWITLARTDWYCHASGFYNGTAFVLRSTNSNYSTNPPSINTYNLPVWTNFTRNVDYVPE
jgi:hypothetical protein